MTDTPSPVALLSAEERAEVITDWKVANGYDDFLKAYCDAVDRVNALTAEHAALTAALATRDADFEKAERMGFRWRDECDAAQRDLAEARAQLEAECQVSAGLALKLAACRRERDEALRLEPLRTRLWCDGCERSRATCFYALDGDVALNCDKCCGHAACTRLAAAQSAPSEREARAPVFVCLGCGGDHERCDCPAGYTTAAPQPAEATGGELPGKGCAGCGAVTELRRVAGIGDLCAFCQRRDSVDDLRRAMRRARADAAAKPASEPPSATPRVAPMGSDLITRMDHEAIVSGLRSELALFRRKHTDRAAYIELERRARDLLDALQYVHAPVGVEMHALAEALKPGAKR